jgi:deoxyribonuclease-4
MQWQTRPLEEDEIQRFKAETESCGIASVIAHDSYLINLATNDPNNAQKSMEAFETEMVRAEQLGIDGLVFHPGSHLGTGVDQGIRNIADSLNVLIDKHPDDHLRLLLENTAGQGTNLGYTFEQLAGIIDKVENKSRVAVCFDTAHAFASGYGLQDTSGYAETFDQFDEIIGINKLKVFHLNDSKKPFGSKVDRHENIGDGEIGVRAFERLLNDPRFDNIPMILETPGTENDFKRNLDLLKSLIVKSRGKNG